MKIPEINFSRGSWRLNANDNFNFQLNRVIQWDGGRLEDVQPVAENGYAVYLFEGPGQGGVVRVQGKKFTHEWEKPVKAVLDAIGEKDVTIMGASLGGMLAPRAAAFEQERIKRVVGWSVFPNFLYVGLYAMPKKIWGMLKWMLRHNVKAPINAIMRKKMAAEPNMDWAIRHGMFAYDAPDPFGYVKKLDDYKMTDIGHLLKQDMLVIGATKDHFINRELYLMELDALPNVRSLTYRLMTEDENGEGHCNVGNPKLVMDTVLDWLGGIDKRDNFN